MHLSPIRFLAFSGLLTLAACGGGGGSNPPPVVTTPSISSVSPSHASPGATVALTGTNLAGATAVSFNGHAAFSFTVVSSTEVDAVVPASAATGTIQVTTSNGVATSAAFTVDSFQVPTIASFAPSAIDYGGSLVSLTGTHFIGATRVQFNNVDATAFSVSSDTLIQASSPTPLAAGTITVTTPGGTGSSAPFQVSWNAPTLLTLRPAQGPVGTPVVITGTNLGYPGTSATLNGAALALTVLSATQVAFTVPIAATSGNLVITTPGGAASKAFTVDVGFTLDLQVGKVQLTQSTQTLDNTVPVVAGKPGLIRVFALANQPNAAAPSVEITLKNNGVAVPGYPKTVAAPTGSVPTVLNEGSLSSSWNLSVPGTDLSTPTGSGYSITAVVDPAGDVAESDKTNNATTVALQVTTVPTFKTTIFPVVLSSGTGNVTAANKDAWAARLVKMYPVASWDVAVGATYTDATITTLASDGTGWKTLLQNLATKHQADGVTDRYYYGALKVSYSSGVAGLGYVPGSSSSSFYYRTAIGWDKTGYSDGGNYPEVFAHETGHNMGRQHSPCGNPANPDPNYPYAGGGIGVWGYDTTLGLLYTPSTYKDIMGYCPPYVWVSDWVYKGILTFRAGTGGFLVVGAEDSPLPKAQATAQDCLLVRGMVHDDGSVELLPSFRTRALPTAPVGAGEYTLAGLDAKGASLFTAPIELVEVGCSPNGHERHFLLALPYDAALLDALAGLSVLKGDQVLASHKAATATMAVAPEATRLSDDKVQLTWDASVHPTVMVRDADTGEVLAILSGGQQNFTTRATRFDLVLSDGVSGRTHRLATPTSPHPGGSMKNAWTVRRFLRVMESRFRGILKDHLYPGVHAAHAFPASVELLG
jgi:hypothetical protein